MSRELADGLAVTAMTVRMEVSIHATAGSFALSRQRARRPPRLEREFQNSGLYLKGALRDMRAGSNQELLAKLNSGNNV